MSDGSLVVDLVRGGIVVAGLLLGLLRDLVRGLSLAQPLAEATSAGSRVAERAVDTTGARATERLSSGVRVAIREKKIKKIKWWRRVTVPFYRFRASS